MKDMLLLLIHLIVSIAKIAAPGGAKGLLAETLLVKHQLLVLKRQRRRAPRLTTWDRLLIGLGCFFVRPGRIAKIGIIVSPATFIKFHQSLIKRKYRLLFGTTSRGKPGPKGPSAAVIKAIVEMKQRNPRYGCPRIAQQIAKAFGIDIDKDVVRRVLAKHYKPKPDGAGSSWLTFIGHTKDSLWSVDMFRSESILLKTHWVMVVMDQYTRRIIGFGIQVGDVDGADVCRMLVAAIAGSSTPKYLSSDNDPLFRYHRWRSNLRVIEVEEIKTVPNVPMSHPFVERLIGTVRRELLDQVFFWNAVDLERKLVEFKNYFNEQRTHVARDGDTPMSHRGNGRPNVVDLDNYRWKKHCGGLFELPIAA